MPLCPHRLHALSSLPALVPPDAFYVLPSGALYWCCRHCMLVSRHLNKYAGHQPWTLAAQRRAWRRYWALRARQAQKARTPPHRGWCSRGHEASREDFTPKSRGWCRHCQAIDVLRRWHARQGRALTWEEASTRHFRRANYRALAKNRMAPPQHRWCHECQAYFVVPATWSPKYPRSRCPGHQAAYQRQWRARRQAAARPGGTHA